MGQNWSKWAEEVLGWLLPSHWQDLVNVLPPRVAAQLTHTNLSPVNLLGRLCSQAVSTAGHERFPADGVSRAWWEDSRRKRRGHRSVELNVKLPLLRPSKSLSYMESTSPFWISTYINSSDLWIQPLSSLALVALVLSVASKFPHWDQALFHFLISE